MDVSRCLRRYLCALLTAVMFLTSGLLPAQAAMIGTETLVQDSQQDAQRAELREFLARDDVRQQLEDWGVDAAAAQARVAQLTDAEVAQLNARIDEMPAGGADLLGALVFVFVLLLITDILGFTDVFPFTRPAR